MHIRRVVDLSLAIDADTQVYPGDPHIRFAPAATIDKDGFNLLSVEMGSQSGTNCDAPYHFLDGGARIDELDLSLFAGRGVIIDVRGKLPRTSIQAADVQPYLDQVGPGTIVVFHTGWPEYYGTTEYFDHPFVGVDACRALLERGVKTFCLDTLNIDETPDDHHPGVGFPVHRFIAQAGGVVVENLTALEQVDFTEPLITVFPLRLTGADGAPHSRSRYGSDKLTVTGTGVPLRPTSARETSPASAMISSAPWAADDDAERGSDLVPVAAGPAGTADEAPSPEARGQLDVPRSPQPGDWLSVPHRAGLRIVTEHRPPDDLPACSADDVEYGAARPLPGLGGCLLACARLPCAAFSVTRPVVPARLR